MDVSRHLVSTTINCFSTPRLSLPSFILDDTYGVEDAFKVCVSLIAWFMVVFFVALVACPPPFSVCSIDYQFHFDCCDLALVVQLMGFGWCNISMFFVLGFPKLFVWALCLL
ncbi:hypothetical protein L3X38_038588 [Prunus dulcis]|uniref:Transmembrane protein n=1 Tax=Prunus dulcis TaxID=3755 RepID=A0AAD4YRN5_PRUDU|nr:hypothetical protein L3X38_038588 [Prunus dulcis]